jgi:hypothetical protein
MIAVGGESRRVVVVTYTLVVIPLISKRQGVSAGIEDDLVDFEGLHFRVSCNLLYSKEVVCDILVSNIKGAAR